MGEDTFHLGIKALIRNSEGKILLLQVNPAQLRNENRSYWDLPGGRVQKSRTVLDTLKREVAEETGITDIHTIKNIGMVLSNIRIPLSEHESVGLILGVYSCKAADTKSIILSSEHAAHGWFAPKEAANVLAVKYPEHFCRLITELD